MLSQNLSPLHVESTISGLKKNGLGPETFFFFCSAFGFIDSTLSFYSRPPMNFLFNYYSHFSIYITLLISNPKTSLENQTKQSQSYFVCNFLNFFGNIESKILIIDTKKWVQRVSGPRLMHTNSWVSEEWQWITNSNQERTFHQPQMKKYQLLHID